MNAAGAFNRDKDNRTTFKNGFVLYRQSFAALSNLYGELCTG